VPGPTGWEGGRSIAPGCPAASSLVERNPESPDPPSDPVSVSGGAAEATVNSEGSAELEPVATIPPMDIWPTPDAPWRKSGDDVDEVLQPAPGADGRSEGARPAVEATGIDPAESEDGGDAGDPEVPGDLESAEVDAVIGQGDLESAEVDAVIGQGDLESAEVDAAELDAIEVELGDIEIALDRLSDGSYGTCEACSRPIADEQLRRNPASRRCAEHLPLPAA